MIFDVDVEPWRRMAGGLIVIDLDTGKPIDNCCAFDTESGWVEEWIFPDVGEAYRHRSSRRFEVRHYQNGDGNTPIIGDVWNGEFAEFVRSELN